MTIKLSYSMYTIKTQYYYNILPGWTGFNTILCKDDIPDVSRFGYIPVIDASTTEYSTINTILKRSSDIVDTLQLQYTVCHTGV
jgi:hypothetical protein